MSEPPSQGLMAIDSIVSRKIWCRRQNLISYQQYQQSVDRNAMQPQDIFWLKWESNRKKLKVGQNKWQTQRISWGYYIFDLANRCSVCNIPSFLFFNLFFFLQNSKSCWTLRSGTTCSESCSRTCRTNVSLWRPSNTHCDGGQPGWPTDEVQTNCTETEEYLSTFCTTFLPLQHVHRGVH